MIALHLTGVIIPTLMHWIPSELHSQAFLGESSTRMGDLLESPRVAFLFVFLFYALFFLPGLDNQTMTSPFPCLYSFFVDPDNQILKYLQKGS